ncbi:hypothetical protein OIE66_01900 [Nonomuraea sp. NBC_01738]|uniref:hypothetical protein n=1 Tax=Nonomuraea sp. NBC_01738 TaxID=2976003 RepID=UPI002E12CCF3|nr:hypothetical protein OIE66_01900 [Nonomuraea sp. NBC_01738]
MSRALALSALFLLAACSATTGGGPDPTASPQAQPTDPDAHERDRQNAIAGCMKQRGFKYVAFVPKRPAETEDDRKRKAGDFAASKRWTEKYGFMAFVGLVYPKDPVANPVSAYDTNPNDKITMSLTPKQSNAYFKAHEECYTEAVKKLTGKTVKGFVDFFEQFNKAREAIVTRALDGDPKLVELAQKYGDCLKSNGIKVTSTKPSDISGAAARIWFDQLYAIGRKQNPKGKPGDNYMPTMKPQAAKPYYDKEVKAALIDLNCGRDFAAAYDPRSSELTSKLAAEWGMDR